MNTDMLGDAGGRDGAFGQGEFRAEAGEYQLAAVDGRTGVGDPADMGVQHAERLEHVCLGPEIAAGILEQLLGASDPGVSRDSQQGKGHGQPVAGPHLRAAIAALARAGDGALKSYVAGWYVTEPEPQPASRQSRPSCTSPRPSQKPPSARASSGPVWLLQGPFQRCAEVVLLAYQHHQPAFPLGQAQERGRVPVPGSLATEEAATQITAR